MNSFEKVYKIVAKIPKGKVLTYKKVSELAGVATPRVVGFALHVNKDPELIPCHRVVRTNGELASGYAFGGKDIQRQLLEQEGVAFLNKFTVNLDRSLFTN